MVRDVAAALLGLAGGEEEVHEGGRSLLGLEALLPEAEVAGASEEAVAAVVTAGRE